MFLDLLLDVIFSFLSDIAEKIENYKFLNGLDDPLLCKYFVGLIQSSLNISKIYSKIYRLPSRFGLLFQCLMFQ